MVGAPCSSRWKILGSGLNPSPVLWVRGCYPREMFENIGANLCSLEHFWDIRSSKVGRIFCGRNLPSLPYRFRGPCLTVILGGKVAAFLATSPSWTRWLLPTSLSAPLLQAPQLRPQQPGNMSVHGLFVPWTIRTLDDSYHVEKGNIVYTVWVKKIHPLRFSDIFSKTVGNFQTKYYRPTEWSKKVITRY